VDTEKAVSAVGSPKVVNLILLGAALMTGAIGISEEDIRASIVRNIPEKFHALNFAALCYAKNAG
jgi:indolepyruvate ferredoxin oxidoreductase beta subunit